MNTAKYHFIIVLIFLITPIWVAFDLTFTMIIREPYPSLVMPSFATSEIKEDTVAHLLYTATIQTTEGKILEKPLYDFFPEVKILRFSTCVRFAYFKEQRRKGSSIDRDKKYGKNLIYANLKDFHEFFYTETPYSTDFDEKAKRLLFEKIQQKLNITPKQVIITEHLQAIHVKTHQVLHQKPLRNVIIE